MRYAVRPMSRFPIALLCCVGCITLGACSRTPADPALVKDPAPLTDCSDDAFISILGGGRAVVCEGYDEDPQVRACIEAPFTRRVPVAHVRRLPGQPTVITVITPEREAYQVRRFARPGGDRVEMFVCARAPEMPPDELPFFCPLPGDRASPVHAAGACGVLERARSLRRSAGERKVAK